jgi:predicted DNA binding CopG/RHH family protein
MKKYTKYEKTYDKIQFDSEKVREGNKKARDAAQSRKIPTSVALPPQLVEDLKFVAGQKGVPYQVLMRMFIVDGFKKFKQKELR